MHTGKLKRTNFVLSRALALGFPFSLTLFLSLGQLQDTCAAGVKTLRKGLKQMDVFSRTVSAPAAGAQVLGRQNGKSRLEIELEHHRAAHQVARTPSDPNQHDLVHAYTHAPRPHRQRNGSANPQKKLVLKRPEPQIEDTMFSRTSSAPTAGRQKQNTEWDRSKPPNRANDCSRANLSHTRYCSFSF